MHYIKFNDTCTIARRSGKDSWDNATYTQIYSGECLYENSGSSRPDNIETKSPAVYVPASTNLVAINDAIDITTADGRTISGMVANVREINLTVFAGISLVKLDVAEAHGD